MIFLCTKKLPIDLVMFATFEPHRVCVLVI